MKREKFWSIHTHYLYNVENSNMWNAWKKCSEEAEEKTHELKDGRNEKIFVDVFLIIMTKEPLQTKKRYKYQ